MGTKNSVGQKWTLLIVATMTVMSAATIAPSLPLMAEVFADIPHAEFLSKFMLTIPAFFIAISAPFFGRYIDKHGRLRLLYAGLVLYAFAGASGYILNDLYQILLGRAFLGLAVSAIMTVGSTLVGDYFEGRERESYMGMQAAFTAVGGLLFVSAGGVLADMNWRNPFLIYLVSLIVLSLVVKFLSEPKIQKSEQQDESDGKTHHLIYLVYATAFIMMVIFYMMPVQLPFRLKELGIMENAMSGAALAINMGFAALSALIFAKIKHRFSYSVIIGAAFIVISFGFAGVWMATDFTSIALAMMISGLGLGQLMPSMTLWIMELAPPELRGKNMGMLTTSLFIGQFVSPILVEPISSNFSLATAFAAAGVFAACYGILFLLFRNKILSI